MKIIILKTTYITFVNNFNNEIMMKNIRIHNIHKKLYVFNIGINFYEDYNCY